MEGQRQPEAISPGTVQSTDPGAIGRAARKRQERARQLRWLRHYARCGSKTEALQLAGIPYRTVARWKYGDERFRAELDQLEAGLSVALEEQARKRAMLSYAEDRSSADLLKFLLRSYRPDRFGEKVQHEVRGQVHVKRIELGGAEDVTPLVERTYDLVPKATSDNAQYVALPEGEEEATGEGTATSDGSA